MFDTTLKFKRCQEKNKKKHDKMTGGCFQMVADPVWIYTDPDLTFDKKNRIRILLSRKKTQIWIRPSKKNRNRILSSKKLPNLDQIKFTFYTYGWKRITENNSIFPDRLTVRKSILLTQIRSKIRKPDILNNENFAFFLLF